MMQSTRSAEYVHALRFGWLTPWYDTVVHATLRENTFKHALISQATIGGGHHVLDLASGTGTLAVWIKQEHPTATVVGVDGDPAIISIAVAKAKKRGMSVRFDQGLSTELPYPPATFDRVVSSLFFHHLNWRAKRRTAQELFRALKPGGELHVADWGPPSNPLMRLLYLSIQLLDGFRNTQENAEGRLIHLFERAGFYRVAQVQSFDTMFGTICLYRAIKPV